MKSKMQLALHRVSCIDDYCSTLLYSREEAVHDRVVVALDAMAGQQALEVLARVLAVIVAKMQVLGIGLPMPGHDDQQIGHKVER